MELWPSDRGGLVVLRTVDSTSALGRRLLTGLGGPAGAPLLVSAWEQRAGRGRRGNRWISPPGGGVYATVLLTLPARADLSALPLVAAAALCAHIDRRIEPPCRIKWPNDLVVDGAKVGGLLLESVAVAGGRRCALIGIGVNLADPREVPGAAGLGRHLAEPPDPADWTVELASALLDRQDDLVRPARAVEEFRALSAHQSGDLISYRDAAGVRRSGRFEGLDERGFLRLAESGGETVVAAAELVE